MSAKVFRSMLPDVTGLRPRLGADKHSLGVVVEGGNPDVAVIDGNVIAGLVKGMSVSSSPAKLPYHRIPEQFALIYPRARGLKTLLCWSHEVPAFQDGTFAPDLVLRIVPSKPTHGLIGPARTMTIEALVTALHATQGGWAIEPWEGGAS